MRFLKRFRPTPPLISVVIVVHNMQRAAPRTLQSFTAAYQGVSANTYEVLVVENGSDQPLSQQQVEAFGPNFRYFALPKASSSPVAAINFGVTQSRGQMVGLMIDGARLVTPGVLKYALRALKAYTQPVVSTLARTFNPKRLETVTPRQLKINYCSKSTGRRWALSSFHCCARGLQRQRLVPAHRGKQLCLPAPQSLGSTANRKAAVLGKPAGWRK